jgi:hypothetical protein
LNLMHACPHPSVSRHLLCPPLLSLSPACRSLSCVPLCRWCVARSRLCTQQLREARENKMAKGKENTEHRHENSTVPLFVCWPRRGAVLCACVCACAFPVPPPAACLCVGRLLVWLECLRHSAPDWGVCSQLQTTAEQRIVLKPRCAGGSGLVVVLGLLLRADVGSARGGVCPKRLSEWRALTHASDSQVTCCFKRAHTHWHN